jgi:hypothetical protein
VGTSLSHNLLANTKSTKNSAKQVFIAPGADYFSQSLLR